MATFQRPLFSEIRRRLLEPRRFVQVLHGPRQVGKTTLARQVAASLSLPQHYASADEPTLRERSWLAQQWDLALEVKSGQRKANVPGPDAFDKAYSPRRRLLVGGQGVPLEEFLRTAPAHWF